MIRKIILGAVMFLSAGMWAQQGTSSPYSYFGIGEIKFRGTFDNRAMGGLSIIPDSTHVNIQNAASVSELKLINYSLGGMTGISTLNTDAEKQTARRSSVDYIAVGIPLGKFGTYFGVLPYSAVGYNVENYDPSTTKDTKSSGTGGVNKGFLGVGYSITPHISVGVDFNYNFGQITTKIIQFRDSVQYGTQEQNVSDMKGVTFNSGLMWNSKIGKKYSIFGSFRYTPSSNMTSTNVRSIGTVQLAPSGALISMDANTPTTNTTTIKMPTLMSTGIGFGKVRKWLIGGEFTLMQANGYSNRTSDITNGTFKNSQRYVLGGYYIPQYNSYSNYFKTLTYRYGLRYDTAGLVVNGQPISDKAVSLGVGLPIGGGFSNFNLGLELGTKGTKNAGLIQENYLNILLSFSLNDKWFAKHKLN